MSVNEQPVEFQAQKNTVVFIENRWHSWLELLLVLLAGAMWLAGQGQLTWQPLIVALVAPVIRIASGRFPFKRTGFELPMVIFLASAAIGIWAAYDRPAAWQKFWLLVVAALFFFALARQPKANLWPIVGSLGFSGLLAGAYFLLTHDWQQFPAKIDRLNRIMLGWMESRPDLNLVPMPPNVAASLMAISIPLLVAWGVHAKQQNRKTKVVLASMAGTLILVVLFMTTSRGAWLAVSLAIALGLAVLISRSIARRTDKSPRLILVLLLLLISVVLGALIALFPGGMVAFLDLILSSPSTADRYKLFISTLNLIRDFPITGSGLDSFAGLYSQYILVIPYFFLANGHNVFLDITLEQGPLGIISAAVIITGAFSILAKSPDYKSYLEPEEIQERLLLRLGIAASMIILLIHGMFEDTIYGSQFASFLFVLPGIAVAITTTDAKNQPLTKTDGRWVAGLTMVLMVIWVGAVFLTSGLSPISIWQSNLGAVEMAQVELAGWPMDDWDDGSSTAELDKPKQLLELSLSTNPNSQTAHFRLGLIAFMQRDFDDSVAHLEKAYALGRPHQGVRKALAFNYVWNGQMDKAIELMAEVPEAEKEMGVYSWWWETQGRADLAAAAEEMAGRLQKR